MIRNEYQFGEPLTNDEAKLLTLLIGWRHGSSVRKNDADQVIGCVAHPDDWKEFQRERRKGKYERRPD